MSDLLEIWKGQKKLKTGYTTGSCAAAASKAAARMLLSGEKVCQVSLMTPKGILLTLDVEEISRTKDCVRCAVRKNAGDDPDVTHGILIFSVSLMTPKGILLTLDVEEISRTKDCVRCAVRKNAGDDPDVTHGILIFSAVSYTEGEGIFLDGGEGVGRVTKKGLEQKIGEAAINKVPRKMILEEVEKERRTFACNRGLAIQISVPEGRELAKKTFNPRLGIEGGISILGTTGIVEPMSQFKFQFRKGENLQKKHLIHVLELKEVFLS